jgi:predicted NUDIX family NTP pyrophosphohydrolase
MPRLSAGILLYRRNGNGLEVLLAHPGGPFWKNKDAGAWSIPKGQYQEGEEALAAAIREFCEETGFTLGAVEFQSLGELKQNSGKVVTAWAVEKDVPAEAIKSNLFPMEWPPKSGKMQEFPEVDRAGWFGMEAAREKLLEGQREFLDRLERLVG